VKDDQTSSATRSSPKIHFDNETNTVIQLPSSIPDSSVSADSLLDFDVESPKHQLAKNAGVQVVRNLSHSAVNAAYSFSDDEDVVDVQPMKPRGFFRFQTQKGRSYQTSDKSQKIESTVKDSAIIQQNTANRQISSKSFPKCNQSPISISSSSSVSDLSESGEEDFYLQPSTPAHLVSDSNMKLSGILGADDFEELCTTPQAPLSQTIQEKTKALRPEEGRKERLDEVQPSPARNSTPKRRTPLSMTRASVLRRSMEASPRGPLIETPEGSLKTCGEKGFRCGKDFCFKCMVH
jgi:hypothetical protein